MESLEWQQKEFSYNKFRKNSSLCSCWNTSPTSRAPEELRILLHCILPHKSLQVAQLIESKHLLSSTCTFLSLRYETDSETWSQVGLSVKAIHANLLNSSSGKVHISKYSMHVVYNKVTCEQKASHRSSSQSRRNFNNSFTLIGIKPAGARHLRTD